MGAYSSVEEFHVLGIAYAMPEFCDQYARAREGCAAPVSRQEKTMANRNDLNDHINRLRDQLRLLALAARSLEDSDDASAMHLGVSQAKMVADEIKALLVNDIGPATSTSEEH